MCRSAHACHGTWQDLDYVLEISDTTIDAERADQQIGSNKLSYIIYLAPLSNSENAARPALSCHATVFPLRQSLMSASFTKKARFMKK